MKIYQKIGYGIMNLVFWLEILVLFKIMDKSGNGLYALGIIISLIIYVYINIKICNLNVNSELNKKVKGGKTK